MTQDNPPAGYSRASIFVHWITAVIVIALFLTHEGHKGGPAMAFHVGGGAVLGLFLLWRVWRRVRNGMTAKPDQSMIFNIISQIVIWGFLATIVVAVISGYFAPWSRGSAIDVYGLITIPAPISANHGLHELMEKIHEVAGYLVVPLLGLHILGVLKHVFIDRDDVARRMAVPAKDGC